MPQKRASAELKYLQFVPVVVVVAHLFKGVRVGLERIAQLLYREDALQHL